MKLRLMNQAEFEIYFAQFRERLVKDGMRAYRVTEAIAKRIVDKDLAEITPYGFETKNNFWFILLGDDGKNFGSLWLSLRGEGEKQSPYLNDLYIAPEFRGCGLGNQAVSLLETELHSRGINSNIAVHIVGDFNEAAIRLFKSAGYFVTAIKMEKTL